MNFSRYVENFDSGGKQNVDFVQIFAYVAVNWFTDFKTIYSWGLANF